MADRETVTIALSFSTFLLSFHAFSSKGRRNNKLACKLLIINSLQAYSLDVQSQRFK